MIHIDISLESDSNWNKRLLNSKTGSTFQTKEFADYVRESYDAEIIFIKFLDNEEKIVGQMILYLTKNTSSKKQLLKKFFKKKNCRWTYGPVIFNKEYTSEIIKHLKNYLKQYNYELQCSEHPLNPNILTPLQDSFKIKPWSTFIIDLSQNKDDIWKKMDKHSARKNIIRSKNKNIEIKMMERKDLLIFNQLRNEKINNKEKVDLSVLELHWDKLKPIGWNGFLAFSGNIPIGGIMFSFFNGYINESGIVRSQIDFENKFYAQDLLKWSIIEWGIETNQKFYDLTGVNPFPKNEKEKGIFRYKKKWGGDQIKYNILEK
jgi:lipid II:glycine glycyltransferase (peptidoglycan interpeptide bridge formation enzyme)